MIRVEHALHVTTITLDRPERRNALSPRAMQQVREALVQFDADPQARAAILTGAGQDAFCAGADIRETIPDGQSFIGRYFDRNVDATHVSYTRNITLPLWHISKPIIAAINGVAAGGGMEIALNADICIASENARFGLTEVRVGSIPAAAGIQRLLRSVPRSVAMQLLLTGELVSAARALEIGIVSEVVPFIDLAARAADLARLIAANAPLAVLAAKRLADKAAELPLREAIEFEELMWGHLYSSKDRIEGRKAFTEKRPPQFRGE